MIQPGAFQSALNAVKSGDVPLAEKICREILAELPNDAGTLNLLSGILAQSGRCNEALSLLNQLLKQHPDHPALLFNLGNVYRETHDWERAAGCFRRAIELQPKWPQASNNLSHSLLRLGRFAEAEEVCRRAVTLSPDSAVSHFNFGVELLRKGHMPQGWQEYEWRLRAPDLGIRPVQVPMPRWNGEALAGKTILLLAEQGFGDTLFFARFVPQVAQRGASVTLAVQPPMVTLLKNLHGVRDCIAIGEKVARHDFYCPLPSLPLVLGATVDPSIVPYIFASTTLRDQWKSRIPGESRTVGLAWAGGTAQQVDRERSIPLDLLAPLAEIGATLVSLQTGEAAKQMNSVKLPIKDWTAELHDFSDTAALMENLDMIVTVDTAAAHLAGALGRKAFLLLPVACDWRWMSGRDDSPWYPTIRLFRQEKFGDWSAPIARLAAELRAS